MKSHDGIMVPMPGQFRDLAQLPRLFAFSPFEPIAAESSDYTRNGVGETGFRQDLTWGRQDGGESPNFFRYLGVPWKLLALGGPPGGVQPRS
jgi:hypothetical protein